ncbi:TPA: type II toxin-antitoxin system RelE/ParE family toxin [Escherichia coli O25b:H4-ST131]|uniref:Type II toxin-antitoxin system RelE/ParE family toxin n=1 Tax=Escherichia coli TaxID=562 RepID=A0A288XFP3_ECOLX|nr:type II toxin-antitoxin system RelE/ParE family toxin [Escherichia coli]HBN2895237.1 type II toxin-antitoxin system RelE/ParE family toxin [Escherichia coli O25b:H4-ST131]ASK37372.1 hypothetical protein [Escherichia coli]ELD3066484.1 type II toxin-antitoxin system RelE/ParE family toxin [Escherichia coli]ELH6909237.1 type II toxin-antitoxin system RelE/ParE family toxin [Escherichia coli]ELL9495566.1 type II toxin-antitoxin system RelE/ParE family toxin [Escherichia coli]
MSNHNIGSPRPELGEYTFALPVERHMVYFLQTDTEIVIIRILSQHQDASVISTDSNQPPHCVA